MNKVLVPKEDSKALEELSLRDHLAIDRTRLANERTLLAFIRTGLYFCIMALTVIKLEFFAEVSWTYLPLFGFSAIFLSIGIITYVKTKKSIKRLYTQDSLSKGLGDK